MIEFIKFIKKGPVLGVYPPKPGLIGDFMGYGKSPGFRPKNPGFLGFHDFICFCVQLALISLKIRCFLDFNESQKSGKIYNWGLYKAF